MAYALGMVAAPKAPSQAAVLPLVGIASTFTLWLPLLHGQGRENGEAK